MKKNSLLLLLVSLCLVLGLSTIAFAENVEDAPKSAIGFAGGFTGGTGLSYKYFFEPDQAVQVTGHILGSSNNDLSYNLGAMYQKVLHDGPATRLYFSPGFSWTQTIDLRDGDRSWSNDSKHLFAGATFGIEFKILERVGLGTFMGYGAYGDWGSTSNYGVRFTGDLSLFYYF